MHALPVAAPGISPYLAAGISGGVSGAVASGTPEGALMGVITATSFAGIGHALPMNGLSPAGQTVAKAGLEGMVSGTLSAASGGKFQAGFLSASFSALAAPHVEGVVGEGYAANLIGQGLVGGLASELGGGKFANGFHTGAFNYMFNDAMTYWFTSLPPSERENVSYWRRVIGKLDEGGHVNGVGGVQGMFLILGAGVDVSSGFDTDGNICAVVSSCALVGGGLGAVATYGAELGTGYLGRSSQPTHSLMLNGTMGPAGAMVEWFSFNPDGAVGFGVRGSKGFMAGAAFRSCRQIGGYCGKVLD